MPLVLTVLQGPDKGKRFELPDNEPQQIGRSAESLPLTDTTISRRHAELTPDQGEWYINDLQSANGTFLNGVRIDEPKLLKPSDQIRTGLTLLSFGNAVEARPVRVVDDLDVSVRKTLPSNGDSIMIAVPDASREATRSLRVIYDLMQLVGSITDKQVLCERVMDLIFDHFQPHRGFMLLRENEDSKLEPVVVKYRFESRNRGDEQERINVSKTIVQHVLKKAEGVLSSNAMTDKRFAAGDSVQAFNIHSAICVPIKFHDKVFGVIHIDSQISSHTFTDDQLRLLTAIGAQTGLALANADLYRQGIMQTRLATVGETVARLSHSIRNMLQAMRGGAELVEMGMRRKDLDVVASGWDVLSRNLDRIYELTLNMLAYSKQRKPEVGILRLDTMLTEIVELMQPLCQRRNVKLQLELAKDMPPIPADQAGLHQAVMNLLNNALDAVEPGNGVIRLKSTYEADIQVATIIVQDNGSGITSENLRRLFTPFFSTKGMRGTGLGLATTKKIIEEHRGRLFVDSKPGSGTSMTIKLPTEEYFDPAKTTV